MQHDKYALLQPAYEIVAGAGRKAMNACFASANLK